MMRIQVRESQEECTLKVEGEIADVAANELELLWQKLTASTSAKIIVNVNGVIRVDRKGRSLLRSMHERGVQFTGARMAIQDILDEIMAPGAAVDNNDL